MKVRVNKRSLSAKFEKIESTLEGYTKERLLLIADDLATRSPVDTGAYAESFSVGPQTRSRTSANRPRKQDKTYYQGVAYNLMAADINALEIVAQKSIPFRNKAPHAKFIEGVFQTFGTTKDKNR